MHIPTATAGLRRGRPDATREPALPRARVRAGAAGGGSGGAAAAGRGGGGPGGWPGGSRPATARSSGIVIEIARHAGESGAIVSSGPRIANPEVPEAVAIMSE